MFYSINYQDLAGNNVSKGTLWFELALSMAVLRGVLHGYKYKGVLSGMFTNAF